MQHPDANEIAAYLTGKYSEIESEALDGHFIDCAECRGRLIIAIRLQSEKSIVFKISQWLRTACKELLRKPTQLKQ